MTVSNELIRNDYTGDGVATAFTFAFRILSSADIQVYVNGALKVLTTDYSVTGIDAPAGGTVTFVVAPANLATVTLIRHMDLHQPIDYTVAEKFPAETHERAIDRATLQKQQVDEEIKRAIRLDLFASPGTDLVITDTPAARADKLLAFSADGLAVTPRGNVSQLEDIGGAVADAEASAAAALVSEQNADASEAAAAGFAADSEASAVASAASAAEAATELPQNSKSADYTAVLADAGGHIFHPVSDDNPRTFTIPANASVAFPLGTTITFVNRINVLTIAITTDTLILAGTGATGSRTLAAAGMATAIKIAPTVWMIGGSGIDTSAAQGSIPYTGPGGTVAHLAPGAAGEVLQTNGAAANPSWVAPGHSYQVRGLRGAPNAATPLTKYDLSADLVVLRSPTTGATVARVNTGTITNDTGLAGPAANGRDQAGAFTASSWLHFYFIWNGTTLATLSSAVAPPTGPTLPSGYTHWAYAGAIRWNASSNLAATKMRGSWMYYEAGVSVLSGGSATVETSVSTSAAVPPNALALTIDVSQAGTSNGSGVYQITTSIRHVSGVTHQLLTPTFNTTAGSTQGMTWPSFIIPNVGQEFFYLHTVTFGSGQTTSIQVRGYSVPNGGE